VHFWFAHRRLNDTVRPEAALSAVERDRADRFHFSNNRLDFEFAHTVLRDVLSGYLCCSPEEIGLGENAFGKPFIDGTHRDGKIEFNLSHAGSLVLIGLCRELRIGVDVEEIRPVDDLLAIVKACFTPRECAFFLDRKVADRPRAFLRCWTSIEGCVKAIGRGLSFPLNSFDMQISLIESSGFVSRLEDSTATGWQIAELRAPDGYVASVAVESHLERLVYFEWQSEVSKERAQSPQ
jgi:4'-phosphopantetheinyl transferase